MPDRPTNITFAEMRDSGVRGLLGYCADYHCSHSIAIGCRAPHDVAKVFALMCNNGVIKTAFAS